MSKLGKPMDAHFLANSREEALLLDSVNSSSGTHDAPYLAGLLEENCSNLHRQWSQLQGSRKDDVGEVS